MELKNLSIIKPEDIKLIIVTWSQEAVIPTYKNHFSYNNNISTINLQSEFLEDNKHSPLYTTPIEQQSIQLTLDYFQGS